MRVQIKLIDIFRDFLPPGVSFSDFRLEFQEGATIGDIFVRLAIPGDLQRFIFCNGRAADADQLLNDGDVVAIFSPIFGG